jgi:hypothetical protein
MISERAGVSDGQARRAITKLADHALAGVIPGKPARYFKVETPLFAVADMLGCAGYVEHVIGRTEARQEANRIGYPSAYRRGHITTETPGR